jgi:molybdopterin synthase catalytic subunit
MATDGQRTGDTAHERAAVGMDVLGVVGGSDDERATLVERLAGALPGRVATVTCTAGARSPDGAADVAVTLGPDGTWMATGTERTLADTLDDLAPECDAAVVAGAPDAALPTVVLGDGTPAGPVLARVADAEDADPDAIVDALADHDPHVTLETLVAAVKRAPDEDRAGAIATFTGRVRAKDGPDDPPTEYLEFERYDGVAAEKLAALREDLEAREGVHAVRLHHRTGVVEAGEDIVFVVVLAGHRGAAFRTVEDGIDRLKAEVPLFKKEVTVDDVFWAHENREGE